MSTYQNFSLTDLIPFISQLKEIFFNWLVLDDIDRCHLEYIVENNENKGIKPLILALEQWDHFQNYGAPGVEMEFVSCDNDTLRKIVESSIILNDIILNMKSQKY
ncbi:PREDICTED: uncharacterized protein LOC107171167 [Diuraphis noxia]|uniref:uncharacterized protein LOC107171167 n=1 Tax=Diuraphis noxia TaxID=143948 RepID=UPI0007637E20|nr:PREDICTED: uncharacterized protein LOC107171167 [Diuraphis noxia]